MTLQTIEGTVDRIRFANAETGWAVLGMMNGRERFAAVGDLAQVEPGEVLALSGQWKTSKYGRQFETEDYRKVRPSSVAGILRFLAGIPGVGFRSAQSLVDHWGEETLERLEQGPEAAREVPGIGPHRAPAIYQAVSERTRRDDVLIELQALHIGASLAGKILRRAGTENAVAYVEEDPYRLRKIDGVGFATADGIAGRLGICNDDPRRIDAGIIHALEEAAQDGHCCLPADDLAVRASKLLELSTERTRQRLERTIRQGRELRSGEKGIYLARLWYAEKHLARRIRELLASPAEAVPLVEPKGIRLSDEQRAAVEGALGSKVFVLTGGPGTGKTMITRAIVRSFLAHGLTLDLASPTGRAAQRLREATGQDAATIHRLLEYHPAGGFRRCREEPLLADVLIVDEVSMLDVHLAGRLLDAVKDETRVILVGDADQLPSVGPGRVLGDLLASGVVPAQRLTRIFRQAEESLIVTNAHRVNRGELPRSGTDPARHDLFITVSEDAEKLAEILVETVVERIPAVRGFDPARDVQVLVPMKKGALGTGALNRRLRDRLNPRGKPVPGTPFRIGDRVMQTRNNYRHWTMNGETGWIEGFDQKDRLVYVRFGDDTKEIESSETGALDLAYACTIHKSQGSEYPCVVIGLHRYHHVLLQRDLFYTALTRARDLAVILGDPRAIARAVKTAGGHRRHTGLCERLQRLQFETKGQ